jgi:hypothetical protein
MGAEAVKPTVRRARTHDGQLAPGWIASRPAYGFAAATVQVTRHHTWKAAHDALTPRTASASQDTQRVYDNRALRIQAHAHHLRRIRP